MAETATQILDVAEALLSAKGYNGFSFREVAGQVGIKSASVHYHFPTKGDLVAAVLRRYSARFKAVFEQTDARQSTARDRLAQLVAIYRRELKENTRLPLCVMLGADVEVLPPPVVTGLKHFYDQNLSWLASVVRAGSPKLCVEEQKQRAAMIMATLTGALVGARVAGNAGYFDHATGEILSLVSSA